MFVCTVRASSVKFFAILAIVITVIAVLLATGGEVFASAEPAGSVSFSGMKTKEDRIAFLNSFGISVKADSEQSAEFSMPENFDRVIMGYNELQRSQGLDLTKYARKRVTRYSYDVEGYEGYDGEVVANLLIYRSRIIACDISSKDPNGFVSAIVK